MIIGNQWVPTPHINWDFAVRVDESDIKSIPALLRSISSEAADRGNAARAAGNRRTHQTLCSIPWASRLVVARRAPAYAGAASMRKFRKVAISADVAVNNFVRGIRRQGTRYFSRKNALRL